MRQSRYIIIFLIFILGIAGCENEGFYYDDDARIRLEGPGIWTSGSDSLVFSFITSPADSTTKLMNVDVCVMGPTTDFPRIAKLTVNTEKTTAPAGLYEFPAQVTIEPGKNKAVLPILLKRDAVLQEKAVRLFISVTESEDFKVGNNEQDHLLVVWSDILTRPTNWANLQEFFGSFSLVKYRFMLNNSGISEFDTDKMSWAELQNYKIKLTSLLLQYNNENPGNPLTDENGKLVDFDN